MGITTCARVAIVQRGTAQNTYVSSEAGFVRAVLHKFFAQRGLEHTRQASHPDRLIPISIQSSRNSRTRRVGIDCRGNGYTKCKASGIG